MAQKRVVVAGGANTDLVGHSFRPLVEHDSNPGYVRFSSGGVGRNIAENIARLGVDVDLVTAFGGDHNASTLREQCERVGVSTRASLVAPELPGSLYVAILDEGGDMALALNDMRAIERLTPAELEARSGVFSECDLVVADANLDQLSLEWLAAHVAAPLVIDPVSAAKSPRTRGILPLLAALKCNALEAGTILEIDTPQTAEQIERAAAALVERGVDRVYLTAGPAGSHYASAEHRGWVAAPRVGVANATGAGDAFTAGVAAGMLEGFSARRCALLGTVMAGMTLESEHTVSERVERASVLAALKEVDA